MAPFSATEAFSAPGVVLPVHTLERMEGIVRQYFQGVNDKDPTMIRRCFGESATIRDVCNLQQQPGHTNAAAGVAKTVPAETLVERCMDFVTAHPDCCVQFYYGPQCGREAPYWVVAHWYETGTWSGESCGIPPPPTPAPMAVEGQTRFRVDPDTLTIQEFVVTRTFTEWEKAFLSRQKHHHQ